MTRRVSSFDPLIAGAQSRCGSLGRLSAKLSRRRAGFRRYSRWKSAERNDGVIIGASSLEQLRHNLTAVTEGPLPTDVLTAIDDAALKARPKWPPYFYGV